MDCALISCERLSDLPALLEIAESHGLGLELQEFAFDPNMLDSDWRSFVARYRKALAGFSGEITLHGSFFDLFCGSPDRRVVAIARERYRQNLTIAAEIGAHLVNFHTNYLPLVDVPNYLPTWAERQVAFWHPLAQEAGALGVTLVLENMWEPDPAIQRRVLESVHSPHLRACLDIGHARIYSKVPLETWIETFSPFLVDAHLHNTNGITDIHLRFDEGLIDMHALLDRLRGMPHPPMFCLELPDLAAIRASLKYLQLGRNR